MTNPSDRSTEKNAPLTRQQYWRKQIRSTVILLAVWFVAGYVMSIFFIEPLNAINFGGVPFGFWMAQQGSIFVFISLILISALYVGRLDEQAGLEEAGLEEAGLEEHDDTAPPPTAH